MATSDPDSDHVADDRELAVVNTYRYLRLTTIVVILMLTVAVIVQRAGASCWQTSISAYYFTGVHSIFVAVLCAIGVCLIVYKGNTDTEDAVLNFSGFLAFVVAFVPTQREISCGGAGLPADFDPEGGITNNIVALFVAGILAEIARIIITRKAHQELSRPARIATIIGYAVLLAFAIFFLAARSTFVARGHTTAAVVMFVGVILVVVLNAMSANARPERNGYVLAYRLIALLMTIALVAIIVIRLTLPTWEHIVIWVEAVLILTFVAFWIAQTAELWDVPDRRALIPEGADKTGR